MCEKWQNLSLALAGFNPQKLAAWDIPNGIFYT
jgi:hypothetical protein